MIKIVDIYKFGAHCPTQWYGKDEATGLWVYFRYRFGLLTAEWASSGKTIYSESVGDSPYDGIMDYDELKALLISHFEFDCNERHPTNEELEAHYG